MPEVIRTIDIAATPDQVWPWFASQEALRTWWQVPDLEIDLQVGGALRHTGRDGATRVTGTVLELDPERRLVLARQEEDAGWLHPARMLFLLDPIDGGTRVTLQHDGFAGIGTATWQRTTDAYERGVDEHHLLQDLDALVTGAAA